MGRNVHSEALHGFERDRHTPVSSFSSRNMFYGIIHGAFFHMATAFADPYAVLPLFLAGFTESVVIIGLVVSLIEAVGILPQLGMARLLQRNPSRAKGSMLVGIWTRCAAWGIIAALAWRYTSPGVGMLALFALLVSLYSLGGGIAVLPFKQVIAQTIRPERRSSFFGWRLLAGGILAGLAGVIVKFVLGGASLSWPRNYGVLFLFSFLCLAVAYIAMSRLRFPLVLEEMPQATIPFGAQMRHALQHYPVLKRLVLVRLLSGGLTLAFPFLTLYATRELGITLGWVGLFVVAQRGGAILSNFIWMPLGNRRGTRMVIVSGMALASLGLATMTVLHSPLTIAFAVALSGAGMSAMSVGFNGYILELGVPEVRPLLFALEGTLLMPLYFMPLLGGWVVSQFGYRSVLLTGVVMLLGGLALALTLCEPRRHDPGCGPRSSGPMGDAI